MLFGGRVLTQVKVAKDIEWAGKEPLPVFGIQVKKDWKIYNFVIPKPCGNIALRNIEEAVPPAVGMVCRRHGAVTDTGRRSRARGDGWDGARP